MTIYIWMDNGHTSVQNMGMNALGDRRMVLVKVSNFISFSILSSFHTCSRLIFIALLEAEYIQERAAI